MNAVRGSSTRECLVITVLTLVGAILRFWNFGRLSLSHFDEGIYAFSGLWIVSKHGLLDLDPSIVAYAPPGFPILVGLSYGVFGVSDYAAIVVAILAGIATIPVAGWLGRRTFGPGAGAAAATFAALAMAHVAFSRKALTDAPFLLAWLVAIGAGGRFLERPGLLRALVMGVAVGVAQNFKYNGWLAGIIVGLAAVVGAVVYREDRRPGPLLRTFGWGLAGALVAGLIYAPWYQFVETHGGYAALVRHHRGYMNATAWWPNGNTQLGEAFALSGQRWCGALTGLLAWFLFGVSFDRAFLGGLWSRRDSLGFYASLGLGAVLCSFQAYFPWWVGLGWTPWLLSAREPSRRLLGSWWLVMTALTPFYHPYARLWLPLHAAGWLLLAGVIAQVAAFRQVAPEGTGEGRGEPSRRRQRLVLVGVAVACGGSAAIHFTLNVPSAIPWSWVLDPSPPSLRTFAFETVPATIPGDGTPIRVYARRPLAFYLAQVGRYSIQLEPNEERIMLNRLPDSWKILDGALLYNMREVWHVPPREPEVSVAVKFDPVTLLDTFPNSAFWPRSERDPGTELYVIAPDQPAAKAEARHDP